MGDFFQGWRRKTGLALLAMALLLTVAWSRSFVIHDQVVIMNKQSLHGVKSFSGNLRWARRTPAATTAWVQWISDDATKYRLMDPWIDCDVEWCWKWGEFNFGVGTWRLVESGRSEIAQWIVPYWSFVLPLTLLSAFLIFSKPRPPKS